jgi:hypothetical protein
MIQSIDISRTFSNNAQPVSSGFDDALTSQNMAFIPQVVKNAASYVQNKLPWGSPQQDRGFIEMQSPGEPHLSGETTHQQTRFTPLEKALMVVTAVLAGSHAVTQPINHYFSRQEGFNEGHTQGVNEGIDNGFQQGINYATATYVPEAYNKGFNDGVGDANRIAADNYKLGYGAGYDAGVLDAMNLTDTSSDEPSSGSFAEPASPDEGPVSFGTVPASDDTNTASSSAIDDVD